MYPLQKVTESTADQILRFLSPSGEYTNIGLAFLIVLATAGALVCLESLIVSPLIGYYQQTPSTLNPKHQPCQCRLCEGYIKKGRAIGEGGFGQVCVCVCLLCDDTLVPQVYLCTSKEDEKKGKRVPRVIKMIEVDLENDVNVLQVGFNPQPLSRPHH